MMPALRRLAVAATLVAVGLAPLACAGGSSSTPPQRKPREILLETEAHDEKVGRDAAEQVRNELGLVDDPAIAGYVDQIGRRLLRYAPRRGFDYRFFVVDQEAPNAFALPGGYIFISRGLLAVANSEDELANVIAHEIIHVAARHAAARQAAVRSLPGPFQFYAMRELAAYSRDQEREADRLGQGLSALAGYDPEGMATFMRDLDYLERLELGYTRLPGFFDTHPVSTERVATAGARARTIQWQRVQPIAGDRAGYLRRVEGLTVGPSARQGVVEGSRFLHPDLGFSMRFPDGWLVINTPQAVGAISPRRDAQTFLQHQGLGRDPRLSAEEFLAEAGGQLDIAEMGPIKIGGLDAFRAVGRAPGAHVMLTWIAFESAIYRLTGASVTAQYDAAFMNTARSFRPLSPEQRASIRELRLRVAIAREGETLGTLSERTGNRWNVQETAIMNDLFANATLSGGQLLKVALAETYPAGG
jgi:predicted Zn-dependent protease